MPRPSLSQNEKRRRQNRESQRRYREKHRKEQPGQTLDEAGSTSPTTKPVDALISSSTGIYSQSRADTAPSAADISTTSLAIPTAGNDFQGLENDGAWSPASVDNASHQCYFPPPWSPLRTFPDCMDMSLPILNDGNGNGNSSVPGTLMLQNSSGTLKSGEVLTGVERKASLSATLAVSAAESENTTGNNIQSLVSQIPVARPQMRELISYHPNRERRAIARVTNSMMAPSIPVVQDVERQKLPPSRMQSKWMTPQTTPGQTEASEEARVPAHKRPHETDSSLDEVEEIESPGRTRIQQRATRTVQATSTTVPISGTVGEPGDSRAERMITEVEHLYNFGVCVGILPEDREILTALRKMKKRFRSLSLPVPPKSLNRRRSQSETQDSGSGSSEGTSSLSAASSSSKSTSSRI